MSKSTTPTITTPPMPTRNIVDLRNELCSIFEQLRDGDVEPEVAKELSNVAGKIINTARTQLQYSELRKEVPNIAFLNDAQVAQ